MCEKKISLNSSFHFLLPLFNIYNTRVIINTYLGAHGKDFFENKLYLLCSEFSREIENHKSIIDFYETEDGNYMYVLKIPEEFNDDYILFLKGKYSKFSNKAKTVMINNLDKRITTNVKDTDLYGVLYKTLGRKLSIEAKIGEILPEDAELASIFNEVEEIYG